MTLEIKKILFATNLSENAHYAFHYAADMAAHYNAGIVILNVVEDAPFNVEAAIVDMLGEVKFKKLMEQHENEAVTKLIGKKSTTKLIRKALRSISSQASGELLPDVDEDVKIIVKSGNVVEEIISQSEENDCGMIIMAYRSRNMVAETIVGGVCRKVLKRTQKPVLLVPMPDKK